MIEHGGVILKPYDLAFFGECYWTRIYFLLKNSGMEEMFASDMNHDAFICYFSQGKFPIFAGKQTPDGWEEVAMAWLEPFIWTETAKVSKIHFTIFPKYRASRAGGIACLLGLKYYFVRYGIDCLYGALYEGNRRARRYDEFLGFTGFQRLPKFSLRNGKLEDMLVGTLCKEDFDFDEKVKVFDGRRHKSEHPEPAIAGNAGC